MTKPLDSRREFVKRAAYVAPVVLTLPASPAFAKSGSEKPDHKFKHESKQDKSKRRNPRRRSAGV